MPEPTVNPTTGPESLLARFDAARQARPDAVAVTDDRCQHTYADLDRTSRSWAARVRHAGGSREAVVAVVSDRAPAYVAMALGVLRAGAAFMPLEPTTPVGRASRMCATARVRHLLVQPGHESYAAGLAGALGAHQRPSVLSASAPQLPVVPPAGRDPAGLAYVIFTSGSTGDPKGAMVTNDGMENHFAAKRLDLELTSDDAIGLTAPLSFDVSVWQALAALTVGARIAVASPANLAEPAELVEWVRRHRVTVLEIVPSFLTVLVDELEQDGRLRAALSSLRLLIATGEALPARLTQRWYAQCPDITMMNAYGPTECADDVTHHVVTPAECVNGGRPGIGREVRHTRIYVVDADGAQVDPEQEGEFLIGGRGVGRGYIGDPVRTALAFVPDHVSGEPGARLYRTGDRGSRRPDGVLDYHGRRDRQVKVRGHRVELGDVEAGLLHVPGVTAAVCVLVADRLDAFVTLSGAPEPPSDADRILGQLRGVVPPHLVPSTVTVLDRMPTGASGKVDLAALARRARDGAAAAAPDGRQPGAPTPDAVRDLIAEVLEVPTVDIDDDFFVVGGDSLRAMTLVSLARQRFAGEALSLGDFLANPTARELCASLERARAAAPPPRPELVAGALSSGQERLWFMEQLHPRHGAQLIRLEFALRGRLDPQALAHALRAVVARHEPLRTVFSTHRGVPIATVWPEAEVHMEHVGSRDEAQAVLRDGFGLSARTEPPPLMRARVARHGHDHHVLTLVLHHLVADGWSLAVLQREIGTFYRRWVEGCTDVPPLATTYRDYIGEERRWLSGPEAKECERYWTDQLHGAPPVVDLPLDRPRSARPDYTARSVVHQLTREETAAVGAVARSRGATVFMAVTAAFYAVLREITGARDLVIGIDSVNRSWPGSEDLVGTFVNQLPVRLSYPSAASAFGELLSLVRRQCLGAYEHDRLPFHKIVAAANPPRLSGRFPLFQVKVTHQSAWRRPMSLPGLDVVPDELSEPVTDLDLMLDMSGESDRLRLELLYRPEVLDEDTASGWLGAVARMLASGAADPGPAHDVGGVPAAAGGPLAPEGVG